MRTMKELKNADKFTPSSSDQLPSGMMGRYEFLINRPAHRIREITEKTLAPLKITSKQYGVLATLHFEGPSSQRDIGETLKIDRTTMVLLIDDLEDKKLLVRDDHPKDRRYYLLNLTPPGKKLFKEAHGLILKAEEEFLKPLSKKERQYLRETLSKLFRHVPQLKGASEMAVSNV